MQKKDVAIIIPYFGKLPENMNTFLKTCSYNSKIDWFIFTDQNVADYTVPNNVFIKQMSFARVNEKVKLAVGDHDIIINRPYKLCDYRPVYGKVFSDYIKGYHYWGYSDIDVVYGDLWKYIHKGIEEGYDKIGEWGHFTLFRNDPLVNNRYTLPIKTNSGEKVYLYQKAFGTPEALHFDEYGGINKIYEENHYSVYTNADLVNDLLFENMDLLTNDKRYFKRPSTYVWEKGKANFYYEDKKGLLQKHEYGYFHFQKHEFSKYLTDMHLNAFAVVTSGYYPLTRIDDQTIRQMISMNHSPFRSRLRYISHMYFKTNNFTNKQFLGTYVPIRYIMRRILKEKNFVI